MVVVPILNVCVPRLFIPVAGDVPVVAPLIVQVSVAIPQLSETVGLVVVTDALQAATPAFAVLLAGQLMIGATLSITVTVNEQRAMFPDASVTV